MENEPYEDICYCLTFVPWYEDEPGVSVCQCGHLKYDHSYNTGQCMGFIIVHPAYRTELNDRKRI